MKILLCTNAFQNVTNGPAKFANHLLEINKLRQGDEIRVLTEDIATEMDTVYRLNLKYPRFLKLFSHIFRMFQYHKKALELRKEYKWDVLVYNNAFIGLWSAYKLGNTVGMINDDNNATVKFGFSYKKIRYYLFKILEKKSVSQHGLILINSKYTKDILCQKYPKLKNKNEILYKGIKLNTKIRVPEFKEPYQLLFVKKDFHRGGLLYLLKAINLIDTHLQLTIVGPFKHELDSQFLTEINRSKHKIEIKGEQSQEETFSLMKNTDIFCVPSLKEALGVANIEALSFGCSVISTNVGGIPEVMAQGKCGWLVKPASVDELKDAIIECIQNPEMRAEKRKYAYKHISKFNIDHTIQNFVAILKENFPS